MTRPLRLSAADHAALTQRAKPALGARAKRHPQTVGEFVAEELRNLPWVKSKRQGETGGKPRKQADLKDPTRSATRQPETGIAKEIRQWLELHGWRCFRHNAIRVTGAPINGMIRLAKGDPNDKGLGDLIAFRAPWVLFIETKTTTGQKKASQKAVLADPRVAPFCMVVRSLEALRTGMAERGIPERAPKGECDGR